MMQDLSLQMLKTRFNLLKLSYHDPSLGLGDGENGRWMPMWWWPIWAEILPFSAISWVCCKFGGLVPAVVVITSPELCEVLEEVEFNRLGEFILILRGDCCCRWFKWPFCPFATQAAIIDAIALCGSWGCGRISIGRWFVWLPWVAGFAWLAGFACMLGPLAVEDGVTPIGGEWVAGDG